MEYQKCPVCNGNGIVSGGFYDHPGDYPYWKSAHTMETCRSCGGKGIIIAPPDTIYKVPETTDLGGNDGS